MNRRLIHLPDRRDWFLIMIGALWVLLGYAYTGVHVPPGAKSPIRIALQIMPLWAWGLSWLLAGLYCILAAFTDRRVGGFTVAPFMPGVWGLAYLAGWIEGDAPRGWLSVGIFWALAGSICFVAGLIDPRPVIRGTDASQ
jgi:hypothetical protein